jgi:uncharacterized protein
MVFDVHAHLYHPSWYPEAFSVAVVRDYERRRTGSSGDRKDQPSRSADLVRRLLSDSSGEATLRVMDRVGISRRVLLILDWGRTLGEAEKSIHQIHEAILGVCRRFPDRFLGFAGVDPRREDATELARRAVETLGARGLKLHPTSHWSLADERVHALVGYFAEQRLPVLVHVGRTTSPLSDRNAQPADLIALAAAFPDIPFVAGHSGFEQWVEFAEHSDLPGNVRFDISGWQDLFDGRPELRAEALRRLVSAFPGRVCFGTDSPFFTYNLAASESAWLRVVTESGIEPSELDSLLSGGPIFGDT